MNFKKFLALFLAALMLGSTLTLGVGAAEVTTPEYGQNYFGFIPVYQEQQDINADVPTLLMTGRNVTNMGVLRDAKSYGDLTQLDEFFSETDVKVNEEDGSLRIDFEQSFAFSPDYKTLYATVKMVDTDNIVIDEEGDQYWEGVDLYLDFGRKTIGDTMTVQQGGQSVEKEILSDADAVWPQAAGDGSMVYHVALSRGGILKASEMGGAQYPDAVKTRVVNPMGDEKNYRGDTYKKTQYIMAIDIEKLGILDRIVPAEDAPSDGGDGPFIGFYTEYTSIHGIDDREEMNDYDPEDFDAEFVYHIYAKQKLDHVEAHADVPSEYNVLSVGKHRPWDCSLLYEDAERTIPKGILVGQCFLEGSQYETLTIPSYFTEDLVPCDADTEGALPVLELGFISVGSGVFENNPYVKNVIVPASIETIHDQAFRSNYIKSIVFEGDDVAFDENGFNIYLSSALKELRLPANMTVFPKGFLRKTALTEIDLPSGLVEVKEDGMRESNLVSVTFPDGFETLGVKGLYHCDNLKEVTFPASTKLINADALQSCYNLERVVIKSMDVQINKTAFLGSNTRNLVLVGYPNSTVHEFAVANGYQFECIDHDYVETVVPASLDTGDGKIIRKCSACGYEEVIDNAENDPWPNPFNDVVYSGAEKSWFANQVKFVYTNKLFIGTSDTTFEPNMPMTRAMFCKVLTNLEKVAVDDNAVVTVLSDVQSNQWYTGAVAWAIEKKIVSGYEDGTFKPNKPITRAEMSVMFYNYLESYKGFGYLKHRTKDGAVSSFTDGPFAVWCDEAIDTMRKNLYISGFRADNGSYSFQPNGTATRAQVAQIVSVVCNDLGLLD